MEINISKRKKFTIVALLGAILFGIGAYAAVSNILAVGTIQDSELFNGPAKVTVREFKIGAGETLAWHYHPGRAYNVIKSGVLTVEDGCGGHDETLTAGDAFEEVHGRHLADLEIAQALRRYVIDGELDVASAASAIEDLRALDLERYAHEPLLSRVWALRHNLTAYDAVYVALAELLDTTLLTCDGRLARAPGLAKRVELIH